MGLRCYYIGDYFLNFFMNLLVKILVYTVGALFTAFILPGVHLNGLAGALVVAMVLIVLNTFLKPILKVLTLPINFITLGFFTLVINGFIIWLADSLIADFMIDGLIWAVLFGLIMSIIVSIFESSDKKKKG